MELWRQAYLGYPDKKGRRVLKPAARIAVADFDSVPRFIDSLKQRTPNIWVRNGKYTYCNLKLFDNETDANSEVFDVNDYGSK